MAYGNTDGFAPENNPGLFGEINQCINCYAENNSGVGFKPQSGQNFLFMLNCGGYSNTGGNLGSGVTGRYVHSEGFITLTSTAFTNAAGGDFSLNSTATGGALLKSAGVPGVSGTWIFPGLSTPNYIDVGPASLQAAAGATPNFYIFGPKT